MPSETYNPVPVSPDDPALAPHAELLIAIAQVTGQHPQVVLLDGVLRFQRCPFAEWQWRTSGVGYRGQMHRAYQQGQFPLAPYLHWYLGLGMSLQLVTEVFGEDLRKHQQQREWTAEEILQREG